MRDDLPQSYGARRTVKSLDERSGNEIRAGPFRADPVVVVGVDQERPDCRVTAVGLHLLEPNAAFEAASKAAVIERWRNAWQRRVA